MIKGIIENMGLKYISNRHVGLDKREITYVNKNNDMTSVIIDEGEINYFDDLHKRKLYYEKEITKKIKKKR